MSTDPPTPHTPRARCYLCHGRRVVIDPAIVEYLALIPCPACSHRDPPGGRTAVEHVETLARAA